MQPECRRVGRGFLRPTGAAKLVDGEAHHRAFQRDLRESGLAPQQAPEADLKAKRFRRNENVVHPLRVGEGDIIQANRQTIRNFKMGTARHHKLAPGAEFDALLHQGDGPALREDEPEGERCDTHERCP